MKNWYCRVFGHSETNHGPFWGTWPDETCKCCGVRQ